jgi:hypothetical protein
MEDRPANARHVPRAARQRRRVLIGAFVGAVVVLALAAGVAYVVVPSSHPEALAEAHGTTTAPRSSTTTALPTTTWSAPATTTTTTTDPGTLPQTNQLPAANTPQFTAAMQALWNGVVQGSVQPALPAFFPQSAYVQLKTGIDDPGGDWTNRLVADYALDIEAAHALIASDPSAATFVGVSVPEQYGHWIDAGVCSNGIGYYEVANARLVYQFQGQTRSFGIASLISWRGEWYVVHLGAILRSSSAGVVEDPEIGPGSSAPSSTC